MGAQVMIYFPKYITPRNNRLPRAATPPLPFPFGPIAGAKCGPTTAAVSVNVCTHRVTKGDDEVCIYSGCFDLILVVHAAGDHNGPMGQDAHATVKEAEFSRSSVICEWSDTWATSCLLFASSEFPSAASRSTVSLSFRSLAARKMKRLMFLPTCCTVIRLRASTAVSLCIREEDVAQFRKSFPADRRGIVPADKMLPRPSRRSWFGM